MLVLYADELIIRLIHNHNVNRHNDSTGRREGYYNMKSDIERSLSVVDTFIFSFIKTTTDISLSIPRFLCYL